MPVLLIDPPVSAYSSPEAIRSWIQELKKMREHHGADPAIEAALGQAAEWLDVAIEPHRADHG